MPRKKVPREDLPALLTELEKAGASDIRRSGMDVRGRVTVRWKESPEAIETYRAALRAWIPVYILSALFLVLIVVMMLFFA